MDFVPIVGGIIFIVSLIAWVRMVRRFLNKPEASRPRPVLDRFGSVGDTGLPMSATGAVILADAAGAQLPRHSHSHDCNQHHHQHHTPTDSFTHHAPSMSHHTPTDFGGFSGGHGHH